VESRVDRGAPGGDLDERQESIRRSRFPPRDGKAWTLRRVKSGLRLPPALVLTVLLAGCRWVVDTTVNPDGSGLLRTAVVYSSEELTAFASAPGNAGRSICDAHRRDAPSGTTFLEEEHTGETSCIVERRFAELKDLAELYRGINGVTVKRLAFQLGRLTFDVEVEHSSGEEDGASDEWRLTLPGLAEEHNADRTEGRTLVWEIAPGAREELHAVSWVGLDMGTLGPAGSLILLGIIGLAGLGIVAVIVLRRRQGSPAGEEEP